MMEAEAFPCGLDGTFPLCERPNGAFSGLLGYKASGVMVSRTRGWERRVERDHDTPIHGVGITCCISAKIVVVDHGVGVSLRLHVWLAVIEQAAVCTCFRSCLLLCHCHIPAFLLFQTLA